MKACPFCGSTEIEIWNGDVDMWYEKCENCNTEGPTGSTPEEAEEFWDKRIMT